MKPQEYINQLLKENDFLKVIQIRAKFQREYPKEFEEYMKNFANFDQQPWTLLCTSCVNWKNNKCVKKMKPAPQRKMSDKQEFFCSSWSK